MSREDVIRQIVERDLQKLELTEESVSREAPELYAAASEFFGTWDTALQYAGISDRRVVSRTPRNKKARTRQLVDSLSGPELVIKELRYLCMTGYDLTASHNIHRDRPLYEASRRHFGSWNQALVAAGINLENIRLPTKPRHFNREELIEALRKRKQSGQTLVWRLVCFENRSFATAVKCAFGSWKRAMTAAGIAIEPDNRPTSRWDLPQILDAIQRLQQEGKSLKCSHVRKEHGALVSAARRFFATWDEAVAAAIRPHIVTAQNSQSSPRES